MTDVGAVPAVCIRRLIKVFGVTPALVGVDLVVSRGTVCGLVGGNGAGKTTLLRCVAAAVRPTRGRLLVFGQDVRAEARQVRALIDFMPASGGAYPDMTAVENLRFALSMRGVRPAVGVVEDAVARAGLESAADELVRTYSTGMVRRLWLARLVLTRAPLLLLDEPYAALDDDGRALVDEIVKEARAGGRSVLLATHDRPRMEALGDVVVRLERGAMAPVGGGAARRSLEGVA